MIPEAKARHLREIATQLNSVSRDLAQREREARVDLEAARTNRLFHEQAAEVARATPGANRFAKKQAAAVDAVVATAQAELKRISAEREAAQGRWSDAAALATRCEEYLQSLRDRAGAQQDVA